MGCVGRVESGQWTRESGWVGSVTLPESMDRVGSSHGANGLGRVGSQKLIHGQLCSIQRPVIKMSKNDDCVQ